MLGPAFGPYLCSFIDHHSVHIAWPARSTRLAFGSTRGAGVSGPHRPFGQGEALMSSTSRIGVASVAVALTSLALPFATASAASDMYLKLGGVEGEIAVQAFSWGTAQPLGATNLNSSKSNRAGAASEPGAIAVNDPGADGPKNPKREAGTMQPGGGGAAGAYIGGKGGDGRADAATGSSEKGFVLPHVLERGSLTVQTALPGCAVGTRYPDVDLVTPNGRYELKEVIVSNCPVTGGGGGGAQATDSVSFNYAKVEVRGWNPAEVGIKEEGVK